MQQPKWLVDDIELDFPGPQSQWEYICALHAEGFPIHTPCSAGRGLDEAFIPELSWGDPQHRIRLRSALGRPYR